MDQNEIPHDPHHLGVPLGASKMIFSLWYVQHKPCTYLLSRLAVLQMDWIELPLEPHHLGVPSGVSKMIYEPVVRSAQTIHISCVMISIITKRTESSFHLSRVTYEYHRMCLKWFLSLCFVWRKPYTYLTPTLILSPSKPKRDSTWPMSPNSSIRCVQNDFRASSTVGPDGTPILRQD
jgi:hypothetical protein